MGMSFPRRDDGRSEWDIATGIPSNLPVFLWDHAVTNDAAARRQRGADASVTNSTREGCVAHAVGTVDRKRPETREHVDSLLRPLRNWSTPAGSSVDAATDDNTGDGHVTAPVTPAVPVHDAAPANDAAPAPVRKTG